MSVEPAVALDRMNLTEEMHLPRSGGNFFVTSFGSQTDRRQIYTKSPPIRLTAFISGLASNTLALNITIKLIVTFLQVAVCHLRGKVRRDEPPFAPFPISVVPSNFLLLFFRFPVQIERSQETTEVQSAIEAKIGSGNGIWELR